MTLDKAIEWARAVSVEKSCAQHVSYYYCDDSYIVNDWYTLDSAVIGFEEGSVLYDYR